MRQPAITLLTAICLGAAAPAAHAGIVSSTVTGLLNAASANGVVGWGFPFGFDDSSSGQLLTFGLTYAYDLDLAGSRTLATVGHTLRETFAYPATSVADAVSISLTIEGHTLFRAVAAGTGSAMVRAEAPNAGATILTVATGADAYQTPAAWFSFTLGMSKALQPGLTLYEAVANPDSWIEVNVGNVLLTGMILATTPLSSATPQSIPAPAALPVFATGLAAVLLLRRSRRSGRAA